MLRGTSLVSLLLVAALPVACGHSNDKKVGTEPEAPVVASDHGTSTGEASTKAETDSANKPAPVASAVDKTAADKASADKAAADKAAADKAAADKVAADKAAADALAAARDLTTYTTGIVPAFGCFEMQFTAAMVESNNADPSPSKMKPGSCPDSAVFAGQRATVLGVCQLTDVKQVVYSLRVDGRTGAVTEAKPNCLGSVPGSGAGIWTAK